jgi:hypothetical protein
MVNQGRFTWEKIRPLVILRNENGPLKNAVQGSIFQVRSGQLECNHKCKFHTKFKSINSFRAERVQLKIRRFFSVQGKCGLNWQESVQVVYNFIYDRTVFNYHFYVKLIVHK